MDWNMAFGVNLAFLDPAASAAGPKPCSAISSAMVLPLTHHPGAQVRGNHARHSCGGHTGSRSSPPTPPVVYAVVTDPLAPLAKPRLRHSQRSSSQHAVLGPLGRDYGGAGARCAQTLGCPPGQGRDAAVGLADQNFAAPSRVTLLKAMSLRHEGTQHRR